jgi:hypothetical protein
MTQMHVTQANPLPFGPEDEMRELCKALRSQPMTNDVTPDEMTPAQLCESLRTNYCVGDAVERCGICGPCVAAEMIERLSGAAEPRVECSNEWCPMCHSGVEARPSHGAGILGTNCPYGNEDCPHCHPEKRNEPEGRRCLICKKPVEADWPYLHCGRKDCQSEFPVNRT